MSKKYVPTFLRKSEQDKELVNTSLPAKEAVPLAPATLASITGGSASPQQDADAPAPAPTFSIRSMRSAKAAPALSSDDFPSLSSKATAQPKTAWNTSFASLASKWATEQKEQEESLRTDAAMRTALESEERRKKAEAEKGLRALGAVGVTSYYGQQASASFLSEEEQEQEKERQRRIRTLMEEDENYTRVVEEDATEYAAEDMEWRRRSKHEF